MNYDQASALAALWNFSILNPSSLPPHLQLLPGLAALRLTNAQFMWKFHNRTVERLGARYSLHPLPPHLQEQREPAPRGAASPALVVAAPQAQHQGAAAGLSGSIQPPPPPQQQQAPSAAAPPPQQAPSAAGAPAGQRRPRQAKERKQPVCNACL